MITLASHYLQMDGKNMSPKGRTPCSALYEGCKHVMSFFTHQSLMKCTNKSGITITHRLIIIRLACIFVHKIVFKGESKQCLEPT